MSAQPIPFEEIRRILDVIRTDVEQDVARWEHKPLTGPNVAAMHGEVCAVLHGLAGIVLALVEHVEVLS